MSRKKKSKGKSKKTGIKVLLALVLVSAVLISGVIYVNSKQFSIEFYENATVNINEKADNYQFVKSIENGEILTEKTPIDTSSLGEKEISLTVKPSFGSEKVYTFSVSVVDNKGPKISFADRLETSVGNEIDLLKGVSATDNSGEKIVVTVEGEYDIKTIGQYKLKYVATDSSSNKTEEEFVLWVVDNEGPVITFKEYLETTKGKKIDLLAGVSAKDNSGEDITVTVEGDYDINKAGSYQLKYVAKDSSSNKTEENFTLKVKEEILNPTQNNNTNTDTGKSETVEFTTSKGYKGVTKNGVTYIDGYLVANKTYSLPASFGNGLTGETKSAFDAMTADAKKKGLYIYISSGFRSYDTQKRIYNNYVSRDGVKAADTYSARAGHSEHQSGLALDVNNISNSFAETPEGIWLNNNCYKYGFILRYPKGKTNETGYIYEPWHFRYVGKDLAQKLYNGGDWITMEDYFGITSEYQ